MRVNYIIYPFVSMFSSPCRNRYLPLLYPERFFKFLPYLMHRGTAYLSVLSLLQGISHCFGITGPVGPVNQFVSVSQELLYFGNGFYSDFFHSSTSFPSRKRVRPCA